MSQRLRVAALVGVVSVTVFAVAELAVRRLRPILDDSALFREPRPYVEFSGRPGASFPDPSPRAQGRSQEGTIELNALGLRGPLPRLPKRDEFRVLVLGGSAVLLGTPRENALPGRLEAAFHARGRTDVRVHNWGVLSYVSGQELALLVHAALDYEPDLVVVYDGANDVFQPFLYDPRPGYPYNWHLYEASLRRLRGDASPAEWLSGLLLRSRVLQASFGPGLSGAFTRLPALREQAGYATAAWRARIAETYLANTRKMASAAGARGSRLAVFLQPMAALKSARTEKETRRLGGEEVSAHVRSTYQLIRQSLPRAASDDASWFDLSEAFAQRPEETFWDLVHVYDEANALLASRMADELERAGLSRPRAR